MSKLSVGDLVATYLTNTSEYETLIQWGIVIDINESVGDLLVVDHTGHARWWPKRTWRLLKKKVDITS